MSDDAVSCRSCGASSPALPLTWSSHREGERTTWLCERCTREQVRGIEARLSEEWLEP